MEIFKTESQPLLLSSIQSNYLWDHVRLVHSDKSIYCLIKTHSVSNVSPGKCNMSPRRDVSGPWSLERNKDFTSLAGFCVSRFVYTMADLCQFDILKWNKITSVSLQRKSLLNNSNTTITIATSLSQHNESARLNKICENMEKQRQKRVEFICQLVPLEANWSRFTRWCVCVCS